MENSLHKEYVVQVQKGHYTSETGYISPARWSTYNLIITEVMQLRPQSVLEIGPGPGIVTGTLRKIGFTVKTLDLDPDINPDYLLSATDNNIPSKVEKIDLIIASEIFEHVEYEDFVQALRTWQSVTDSFILTLPDTNRNSLSFGVRLRLPILNKISFLWKVRFKKNKHEFDGEHYWEIGKKSFHVTKIRKDIRTSGWNIQNEYVNLDNPYHRFFILKKQS